MDPRLAEIYGTNEEADVEKVAAAELAEKLAEGEDLDLDSMTPDQVEALAQEVLSADEETETAEETETETEETEESPSEEDGEKVAAAEFEQADFLGRVMAHSFVNECKSIEKEASYPHSQMKKTLADKAKGAFGKLKGRASGMKEKAKSTATGAAFDWGRKSGKDKAKTVGKAVGAAGAAGLAGYGAKKALEKKSSALDTLATERALEILKENGVELEAEQGGEEKKAASKAEILQQAVEARAIELLEAEGFKFEE